MSTPVQPPNTPTLDRLVAAIKKYAIQLGVNQLVIVGRDPQTNETRVYGDKDNEQLRALIAEKFALADVGDTSWEA